MSDGERAQQDRESIHEEHHLQLDLLTALRAAVADGASAADVALLLGRFLELVRQHFASEEALMTFHGYEKVAPHRAAHAALLSRFETLAADHQGGARPLTPQAVVIARSALAAHLAHDDEELDAFLQSRAGIGPPLEE